MAGSLGPTRAEYTMDWSLVNCSAPRDKHIHTSGRFRVHWCRQCGREKVQAEHANSEGLNPEFWNCDTDGLPTGLLGFLKSNSSFNVCVIFRALSRTAHCGSCWEWFPQLFLHASVVECRLNSWQKAGMRNHVLETHCVLAAYSRKLFMKTKPIVDI